MSPKKDTNRIDGVIQESLPNTLFRVKLDNGNLVLAHLAGKLRIHRIKILPGDKVTIEMASIEDDRGRIVYRKK